MIEVELILPEILNELFGLSNDRQISEQTKIRRNSYQYSG